MEQLILVTGATSGIGRATAFALARRGARVIVHGRDPAKVSGTAAGIRAQTGAPAEEALADLSSQREVAALAADVARRFGRLDVLLNNAGVYMHRRVLTDDGVEMTLAVNVIAPFLLTRLLLPTLASSAPARVVNVASVAHRAVERVDLDDLQGARHFSPYRQYALSKLGDILLAYEQARRIDAALVTCNALHPGTIATKLLHAGFGFGGEPVEKGGRVPVFLALSPETEGVTGQYFTDEHATLSSPLSYDDEVRAWFWHECERLVRVPVPG